MASRRSAEISWVTVNSEGNGVYTVNAALCHAVRDDEVDLRCPSLYIILSKQLATEDKSLQAGNALRFEHAGNRWG
jgi:hypothetical protein